MSLRRGRGLPLRPSHSAPGEEVSWSRRKTIENVVSPPRNPVTTSRRSTGGNPRGPAALITPPMTKPPRRLALSVLSRTVGKTGFNQIPRTQRSQAPNGAPTPTASKPSTGKRQPSGATAAVQAVVNRRVGLSHDDLPLRRSTAGVGIISFTAVRGECHLR